MNTLIKDFLLSRLSVDITNTYLKSLPQELYLELIKFYINHPQCSIILTSSEISTEGKTSDANGISGSSKEIFIHSFPNDIIKFSKNDIISRYDTRKEFINSIIKKKEYMYMSITEWISIEIFNSKLVCIYYEQDSTTGIINHNYSIIPISYELFNALLVMLL